MQLLETLRTCIAASHCDSFAGSWSMGAEGGWHVAWAGASSTSRGVIEVPAALAKGLNLTEGITVAAVPLPEVH